MPAAPADRDYANLSEATRIRVPVWAWALVLLALAVVYLVLQENGAVLAQYANTVHEFAHDGRHALGVPCH
jgi:type VI protein secretion system component VasF